MLHSGKQGKGVATPSRLTLGGQSSPFTPRMLPEPVLGPQAFLRSPSLRSKEVPQRGMKPAELRAGHYSSRENPASWAPLLAVGPGSGSLSSSGLQASLCSPPACQVPGCVPVCPRVCHHGRISDDKDRSLVFPFLIFGRIYLAACERDPK